MQFSKKQLVHQTTPFLSRGSLSSVAKNYKCTKNTNKSKCSIHSFHTPYGFLQVFFFTLFDFRQWFVHLKVKKKIVYWSVTWGWKCHIFIVLVLSWETSIYLTGENTSTDVSWALTTLLAEPITFLRKQYTQKGWVVLQLASPVIPPCRAQCRLEMDYVWQ